MNHPVSSENSNSMNPHNPIMRLHDIWALIAMEGFEDVQGRYLKSSAIEIHVNDKRITGNSPCNQFSGGISVLTDERIELSMIASTKRACPDLDIESEFYERLQKARSYRLEELNLVLMDGEGFETLRFLKVD